jgi:hypothetical protein
MSRHSSRVRGGTGGRVPFARVAAGASEKLKVGAAALSALLALALAFAPSASSAGSVQGGLSRAASALAGQPVVVVCIDLPGLEGEQDAGRVWLDLDTCAPLLRRIDRGPANVYAAESAAALAHEVGHMLLGACEYQAERYAMAHWRQAYGLLGLGTPDSAAAAYVRSVHQALPREYRFPGPGC